MFNKLKLKIQAWNDRRLGKKYKRLQKKLKATKPLYIKYFGIDGQPTYYTKEPVYKLGSADPVRFVYGETNDITKSSSPPPNDGFTKGYNSFSGIDIKVHMCPSQEEIEEEILVKDKDGKEISILHYKGGVGTVQGVKFWASGAEHYGRMTFIVFDNFKEIESFAGKEMRLMMTAANEYGNFGILVDKIVLFDKHYNWEVSVDDIVTEVSLGFVVVENEVKE
jgi:hypothetical protein